MLRFSRIFWLTLVAMCALAAPAEAQTVIGQNCTLSWAPNVEPDIRGYEAQASRGAIVKPLVGVIHPAVSTSCTALGVDADGLWTFSVRAYDQALNKSASATIQATRDTGAPAQPTGLTVTSNP